MDLTFVSITLDGVVVEEPELIRTYNDVRVYAFSIDTKRLSGLSDRFVMNLSTSIAEPPKVGDFVRIYGDLRVIFGNDTGNVVYSYIGVSKIVILDSEPENYTNNVIIDNAKIVSDLTFRKSMDGSGKDVCFFDIELTYSKGRRTICQCNTYNKAARYISSVADIGANINVMARLQSRKSKYSDKYFISLSAYNIVYNEEDD